jgi:hypothetical protein
MSRIASFVFITLPLVVLFSPLLVPILLLHVITGGTIWRIVQTQGDHAVSLPDRGPTLLGDDDLWSSQDSPCESHPAFNIDGTMMLNDQYDMHGNAYGFVADIEH